MDIHRRTIDEETNDRESAWMWSRYYGMAIPRTPIEPKPIPEVTEGQKQQHRAISKMVARIARESSGCHCNTCKVCKERRNEKV